MVAAHQDVARGTSSAGANVSSLRPARAARIGLDKRRLRKATDAQTAE
jgi:hypothetical protein